MRHHESTFPVQIEKLHMISVLRNLPFALHLPKESIVTTNVAKFRYKLKNCTGQAVRVAKLSTILSPVEHIPLSVQQLFDISWRIAEGEAHCIAGLLLMPSLENYSLLACCSFSKQHEKLYREGVERGRQRWRCAGKSVLKREIGGLRRRRAVGTLVRVR